MLQLGFMWRSHGCFRNLRDDLEISVDFFCDPCAQISKRFMTVTVSLPGTITMLMQQQMVRHLVMALARILMMTLAFVLLARLELVAAGVESVGHGVGKGKARRVHTVHVLQSQTLLRLQSKSKVHRG